MEVFRWVFISYYFDMIFLCTKAVQLWNSMQMTDFIRFQLPLKWLKTTALATGTFIFAFGGVIIGGIAGAIKGQTTEIGFCRGAGIGVISGAIVALELLDSLLDGHFMSKVALFGSIFNGKAFREWVSQAVLKAYQFQVEGNGNEASGSDIYNIDETRGISSELINKLPMINFHTNLPFAHTRSVGCTICLQDFVEGERARKLVGCQHMFHQMCIDEWLSRSASCPICRNTVIGSQE